MTWRWAQGPHHALVHPGLAALVSDALTLEAAVRLWEASAGAEGVGAFVDQLARAGGTGFVDLVHFAVAVVDDDVLHLAARGDFRIRVVDGSGTLHEVDGSGVATVAELRLGAAEAAVVTIAGPGAGADGADPARPLVCGLVGASALVRTTAAAAAAPAVVAPSAEDEAPPTPVEDEGRISRETLAEAEEPVAVEEPLVVEAPVVEAPVVEAPAGAVPARFASLLSQHTVLGHAEDAEFRPTEDEEGLGEGNESAHAPKPAPQPAPVVPTPQDAPVVPEPVVPAPVVPEPVAPAPVEPAPAGFIASVPWSSSAPPAAPAAPAPPAAAPATAAGPTDQPYEHHDGHTALGSDHEYRDGHTVLDLEEPGQLPGAPSDPRVATVPGLVCGSGHVNPPHRVQCRVCSAPLPSDPVPVVRPSLGWLHTSAGEAIELSGTVVAGRDPRATRFSGTVPPRLLPLPHDHVSRTHLEIRLEGWSVLVVDLDSFNGTYLQRPGEPVKRLSGAPHLLAPGDVVLLNHGVDLRFTELP